MRSLFLTLAFLLLAGLCAGAAPLQAQSETDASLEAFLQELEAELERGEAERLIDPWFLKDIRALMVRHSWPWQTRIFADDFSADGPDPAPPWEVTAGEFLIDWRHGLRSRVVPARERQQSQSNEGAVAQLFGQIITQAAKGDQSDDQTKPKHTDIAAVRLPLEVPNAFALAMEFSLRPIQGVQKTQFVLRFYAKGKNDYRIIYRDDPPQREPQLLLARRIDGGKIEVVAEAAIPGGLTDSQTHRLVWTRDRAGLMSVRLDDAEVLFVEDRKYNRRFRGLQLFNNVGDIALRQVVLDAAQ